LRREIEQSEAVLLEEILYVIFRRKLLIAALLLIAGGIFAYGVLTEVDVYKGEAIVMIRRLPLGYQMPAESRSVLLRGEVVNSEIAIITSPAVAEAVVDRLRLDEGKDRARAIHNVNRQIKGEAEPESNIIKISYSNPDPVKAAEVTNAALDGYLSVRARVALDYDAVDYLDQQAQRVRAEIDSIGAEISRYGAEDGQLSKGVKGEHHMGLINQFVNTLTELDSSIYSDEEKIAATEEWLASEGDITQAPNSEIYDMATVRESKITHLNLKSGLAAARARYAPDHPEVRRLERELSSAALIVRTEIEQALLRQKTHLDEWRAERRATVRILDELAAQNSTLSNENMQIRLLEHELSIRADLYSVIMDRREQFRITAATDPTLLNIGVVSRATVPVEPDTAEINMKSVFAFFTLLFGLAFVFAVERMDLSLVRRSDIERELGLKVLAVVRYRARR
jgi:succinoglycan biosynthesis transport protein ExoP